MNPTQQAAIDSRAQEIAVIAGPGSGKTEVLACRIVRLVADGTPPAEIACMTYTNAGAKEMEERIARKLGDVRLGYLGTVHGYCFRLLQKYGHLLGYARRPITLARPDDLHRLTETIIDDFRLRITASEFAKNQSPAAQLGNRELRQRLKRANMITYDRVLEDGLALQLSDAVIVGEPAFHDLLVDEAQDSGEADWAIYNAITAINRFVVGDVDQAIYTFRGGRPTLLMDFAHTEGHVIHTLETNYRSTPEICEAATELIAHNTVRIPKAVKSAAVTHCNPITYCEFQSAEAENGFVLGEIHRLLALTWEDAVEPTTIAVLTRTNDLANGFAELFRQTGLPVESHDHNLPLDWEACLTTLSLCLDPLNDFRAYEWAAWRNGAKRAHAMRCEAAEKSVPISSFLPPFHPLSMAELPGWLAEAGLGEDSISRVTQALAELPFQQRNLPELVRELREHEFRTTTPGIHVGTIHSAKGLEWDTVFCVGWEEGTLPNKRDDLEEARRLAFVAITRAATRLYVSGARQRRMPWGQTESREPSRFIKEMQP